jgi:hypothetical protein
MEQLFGAIPSLIRELGANAKTDEAVAFAAWKRCAGERLCSRAVPLGFLDHRLVVGVADKVWQRHLQALSPQMIAKLNAVLGDGTVKFIEFRILEN